MVWDGLIILLFVTLAVAGWNIGIVNSWRGPFALLAATAVTKIFYIDFATWVVQQLRLPPLEAIAVAYVLLWGLIEILVEVLMSLILQFNRKVRPMLFERVAGALFGILKAFLVVLLPAMAMEVPNKVPEAPPEKAKLINLIQSGADKSSIIALMGGVAKGMLPSIGGFVVSTKAPSFKPDFRGTYAGDEQPSK